MSAVDTMRNSISSRILLLIVAMVAAIAIVEWYYLFDFMSVDARYWFIPWLNTIIANGPVDSLARDMPVVLPEANGHGNYAPPYFYLLIAGSVLHPLLAPLTIIKVVAVAGSLLCALCLFLLLTALAPWRIAVAGAAGMLVLPTVTLNATAWGQADAFWSAFVVLAVAAALRERWSAMMIAFGIGMSIKLQAVFLGPFILYMALSRRMPLWTMALPLPAFAAMHVPAWLAGRPAMELAMIYMDQAHTWPYLSMNVPNPWAFIQYFKLMSYPVGTLVGLVIGCAAGLAIGLLAFRRRLEGTDLLLLALTSTALMPYLLPKMSDRYFFAAEILSLALALARPRQWTIAVAALVQLGALGAYAAHLVEFLHGRFIGAILIGAALLIIIAQLARVFGVRSAGSPMMSAPAH